MNLIGLNNSEVAKTVKNLKFFHSKMADTTALAPRGGFGRGRGKRGDDKRGSRGRGRRGDEETKWVPVTKLGRLVNDGHLSSIEEVYLFSLPIKEYQIVDKFLTLKDEVMKIMPVQKQTCAGQRTRFKAFVIVGDSNGHCGLGVKCSKEVASAIKGAIILAKLSCIPIRRGYWGSILGNPHTVPAKVTGKCGSVTARLVPAPRGTGIVAAPVPKKLLQMAGIDDCYTTTRGSTKTQGNFLKAVFIALSNTYGYLTPDLWQEHPLQKSPFEKFSHVLSKAPKKN